MDEREQMENEIKGVWFKNHIATITEHEGITILDWGELGTSYYSVRYIFASNKLYISGDIGEAIFDLTWQATPQSFNDMNLGYLIGKLSCCSRRRWDFSERKAIRELKEWYAEAVYDCHDDDKKEILEGYQVIKRLIYGCIDVKDFEMELFNYYQNNSFDYLDSEDFSMFSDFGKQLSNVFFAYLLGIKLANKQNNHLIGNKGGI